MEQLNELFPRERISLPRIAGTDGPAMQRLRSQLAERGVELRASELADIIAEGIPEALRTGTVEALRHALHPCTALAATSWEAVALRLPPAPVTSVFRPTVELIMGGDLAGSVELEARIETRLPAVQLTLSGRRGHATIDGTVEMRGRLLLDGIEIAVSGTVSFAGPGRIPIGRIEPPDFSGRRGKTWARR
jgi:hypothetical protein